MDAYLKKKNLLERDRLEELHNANEGEHFCSNFCRERSLFRILSHACSCPNNELGIKLSHTYVDYGIS